MKNSRSAGFTLIEVMIVMFIVCILAAVAMPSYTGYVLKSHRAKAQAYVMDLAHKQESYYQRNNRFASFEELDAAGLLADDTRNDSSVAELDNRYTVTSGSGNDDFWYQLAATSQQAEDAECLFIRIDQDTLIESTDTDSICFPS